MQNNILISHGKPTILRSRSNW